MFFALLLAAFALVLDLPHAVTRSRRALAVAVVVLRQQVRMYQRKASWAPRLARWDKVLLAAIVTRYRALASAVVIVQPDTLLRWHRDIVKRKWTYGNTPRRGRPTISTASSDLIVRFARENRAWGYGKLQGELLKLGHRVSQATIRRVPRRHDLPPAPRREHATWRAFLAQHREQLLACAFFTVDTLFLQRLHVLFFIELGPHRTPTPSRSASFAPSARNAWTRCSSSTSRTYGPSWRSTWPTTTTGGHIRPGAGAGGAPRRCPGNARSPRTGPVPPGPRRPHQRRRRGRLTLSN